MREKIENAVQIALGTFLQPRRRRRRRRTRALPLTAALEAAYALGRGEARSGRSMDALLAAYRVGARVAWRELAATTVAAGWPRATVAQFAELIFAYIDELSAASVAGHADELASAGRARRRYLERLAQQLLAGEPRGGAAPQRRAGRLAAAADADRRPAAPPPACAPCSRCSSPHTLESGEDLPAVEPAEELAVLLVPDVHGGRRRQLARLLHGRRAVLGPARPWHRGRRPRYARASPGARSRLSASADAGRSTPRSTWPSWCSAPTRRRWPTCAPRCCARWRRCPPATAHRLAETLRAWLLHQGRRDDVAAELFVHPQTVRYRMAQLRELYGDRLHDPATVLDLTVALAVPPAPPGSTERS